MDANKFIKKAEKVYEDALAATIELLKQNGDKRFIACEEAEDDFDVITENGIPLMVYAVGLNDAGNICIKALVRNVGYGYTHDDFPEEVWVDITENKIDNIAYPEMYRFVVDNLEEATDKA